ncbi:MULTISPECIES: hypothetical protein [unclassified Streptomyces]|uniref:hypothetical protein n=1 Tax=unclassified Streptomyces TaxID=2593676 RepID=UPI0035E32951
MVTARQTRTTALGALALALALTGCGGGSGDAKAPPTTAAPAATAPAPAPATSSADPEAAEKRAVLAAYASMWAEQMKAYAKADAKGTDLGKYTSLDALGQFRVDLARMKQAGTIGTGTLGHEPKVTALDTTGKLPRATIEDCLDLSGWKAVRVKTGEPIPLPSNQPRRYIATATAEKWPNGWMVTVYKPHGERTC